MFKSTSALVIGLGRMGREHASAYNDLGITWESTNDKVAWRDAVDRLPPNSYVSVCSYDDAHAEQIIYALERGHRVIAEKPLCLTERELDKINRSAAPGQFTCNLPLLWQMDGLQRGAYHYEADYNWGRADRIKEWRSKCPGYSFVLGAGVHLTSTLQSISSRRIMDVQAIGQRHSADIDCETMVSVIGTLKGGASFRMNINCAFTGPHTHRFSAWHEDGETWVHSGGTSDKTREVKNFVQTGLSVTSIIMDAHSACFAIERALKSGKREQAEYLQ